MPRSGRNLVSWPGRRGQGLTRARTEKKEGKEGKDFRGVKAEEVGLTCGGW